MVDIEEVTFRNFLSYGDYDTTIPVSKMGACLITGNNGSGKSTIINAMLWTLFGRTMHSPNVGDNILNDATDGDAVGILKLRDGRTITRVRRRSGDTELIVDDGDDDRRAATASTTQNQQEILNKHYGLDWGVFCGSAFFTQLLRSLMELPEPLRKKELERSFHLDRYAARAAVAKKKLDDINSELSTGRARLSEIDRAIASATDDIETAAESRAAALDRQQKRREQAAAQAAHCEDCAAAVKLYDIDKLKKRFADIALIEQAASKLAAKLAAVESEQRKLSLSLSDARKKLRLWESRAGKVCLECEQDIPHAHTDAKVTPIRKAADDDELRLGRLAAAATAIKSKIDIANAEMARLRPSVSVRDAEAALASRNAHLTNAAQWRKAAQEPIADVDDDLVAKLTAKKEKLESSRAALAKSLDGTNVRYVHIDYIFKSYNDRKKIRSHAMARFLPPLNRHIAYYSGKFDIDVGLEFSESLAAKMRRKYEYLGGGERKRLDTAILMARFDVYKEMFGRQSNVIVLDEVDSRMDDDGVVRLSEVILEDLTQRVDALFVISHKKAMRDVFPHQIVVEKDIDGFSRVAEIR